MKAVFFQCDSCGDWRYTTKKIRYCKCFKCGKQINFAAAKKEMHEVDSVKGLIRVLQKIKMEKGVGKDPKAEKEFEYMYGDKNG